jgi:glycosyltransferase involved in cell wall biosynthesis
VSRSILHVAAPTNGGVPRYVENLALEQLDRGFQVTVASPPGSELATRLQGSDVRVLPWKARREPGATIATEKVRLGRIVRDLEPDLVHLHAAKAGLAGRLALRGALPTIFQPHAWSFEAATGAVHDAAVAWERFAARWADVIVCVSEAERGRGEEAGIDASWRVVPNGVDLTAFPEASAEERRDARDRLRLNGAPLVLCVGRLCRQKGQDVLLRAWPAVVERVPDAELVLVGDGPDERRLARAARSGVHLVGTRDDVGDWMAAADVFVTPSRWEGMSLAMLEAMACGRSIVATDVPGAREAIDGNGAVVPVESADAIAQAVVERLADPAKAAAEGQEARRRAETFHDFRQTAEAVSRVYGDVLRWRTIEATVVEAEEVAAQVG